MQHNYTSKMLAYNLTQALSLRCVCFVKFNAIILRATPVLHKDFTQGGLHASHHSHATQDARTLREI